MALPYKRYNFSLYIFWEHNIISDFALKYTYTQVEAGWGGVEDRTQLFAVNSTSGKFAGFENAKTLWSTSS